MHKNLGYIISTAKQNKKDKGLVDIHICILLNWLYFDLTSFLGHCNSVTGEGIGLHLCKLPGHSHCLLNNVCGCGF